MERLKFLGIFSSNMDEFFKVRVASMHRRIELGRKNLAPILEMLSRKSRELDDRFQLAYADITNALAAEGIQLLNEKDLRDQPQAIQDWVSEFFQNKVLVTLVPILIDQSRPFPRLTDGALYFGVKMWGEELRYAILEIPREQPRFVELPNGNIMYVDDVIRYALNDVFYIFEYDRIEAFEFKISRDAEIDIDNDFSEDYVRMMERELQQRKGGRPVRLVYDAAIPPGLRTLLLTGLEIGDADTVIAGGRYHNMKDLMRFPNHRPDLSFEALRPAPHPIINPAPEPLLDKVFEQDLLVTYPYQSFDHVIRLLREAAIDPEVEEIKMTLYRVARRSQVVNALMNAARNGKRIFVSVELQARFDEQNNIRISEALSEAGAEVVYGVPPMKVHAKLLLIQRRDRRSLCGLSTGNFNEVTGQLYVDTTLLTADTQLTEEVGRIFEFLERAARMRMLYPPRFKHLLVSPVNTRKTLMKLLAREKAKGKDGYVFLKVNHLTDTRVIRRIREAANAGVRMDLVVRTTHALSPQKNIRAISILDRYLEHQRVYWFGTGEDREIYLSSADLMERNLDWRVEAAFPIRDPGLQQQIADIMELQITDNFKARVLDEKQTNPYVKNGGGKRRAQQETAAYFDRLAKERAKRKAANE
jgi:polyphosphate kinase